jgi:hypothetical protein
LAQPTAIGATARASHIGDVIHGRFLPVIDSTSFATSTTDRHAPGNRYRPPRAPRSAAASVLAATSRTSTQSKPPATRPGSRR